MEITRTKYRCNVCGYPCEVDIFTSGIAATPPEFTQRCVMENSNNVPIWTEEITTTNED